MRTAIWTAVAWSVCAATIARAEEKLETPPAAEVQATEQPESAAEATTAPAEEATPAEPAEPTVKVEEAAPAVKPAEPTPAPVEPAHVENAEPEKTPPAKAVVRGPFQGSWQEASADEKALFLEAFGESSQAIQERWDKASSE